MTNIGLFFKKLSELSAKVPPAPWGISSVETPTGKSVVLSLGFTMVPRPDDPRVLTRAPVSMTFPPGNVDLNFSTPEQAEHVFKLITLAPAMMSMLFELRTGLLKVADILEREAYSVDAKKTAVELKNELAFDGEAPGKIITL